MRYSLELEHTPDGFALNSAAKGEQVHVVSRAFVADLHGEIFYRFLESTEGLFLEPFVKENNLISQIDHFLVMVKDNRAIVYINELSIVVEGVTQRSIQKGERIRQDDIIGVNKLWFQNLFIPEDVSIAFYFSIGWRRGFYFDFRPNSGIKLENVYQQLGKHYQTLKDSNFYRIGSKGLEALSDFDLVPFVNDKTKFIELPSPAIHILPDQHTHIRADTPIFDDEIRELVTNLGQHPASGAEIVAEGLTGAWADQGIEDSVAWLAELRRRRRDKFR